MAYIGQGIKQGTFKVLDTSGNTYNGSNTTFSLGTQVGAAAQLLVSHDGVIQLPGTDYTLASGGASITFTTAPASGASIFIVEISGAVGGTVTPSDNSVGITQLNVSDGSNGQALTTNGSGTLSFSTISTGLTGIDDQSSSNDDQVTITDTAVVINEDSDDVDFRVESNGNANMLFVSGGNDVVGVGAEGDLGVGLHIKSADSSGSVDGNADELVIEGSGQSGITILSGASDKGNIFFADSGSTAQGKVIYNHSTDTLRFDTAGSERASIGSTGVVEIKNRMLVDGQIDSIAKINVVFGGDNENGMQFSDKDGATNGKFIGFSRDGTSTSSQGTQIGFIARNGSSDAINYSTSSDYRLKDGIVDKTDGIEKLKQLQPKKFYWKSDLNKTLVDGFLAHEVSSVVPEAIIGEKDAVDENDNIIAQGIDQGKLTPLLTAALQEAITKIETLEAKVKTLEEG
jgi:hypothetical protein